MTIPVENIYITMLAKGRAAELRSLADACSDKAIAEIIYRELVQIARKLDEKHRFSLTKELRTIKSVVK